VDNEYLQAMTDDTALTVSLKSDWLFGNVSDLEHSLGDAGTSTSNHVTIKYYPRVRPYLEPVVPFRRH